MAVRQRGTGAIQTTSRELVRQILLQIIFDWSQ